MVERGKKMKLLEWNINKRSKDIPVDAFVYEAILEQKADIICLVEYRDDQKITDKLDKKYWLKKSVITTGNQLLIAVSKDIAPYGLKVIRETSEENCYNFLHISFTNNFDKNISVIGIKMFSPIDAEVQTPPLNLYLSKLKEPFVCPGDFNIKTRCMKKWFPNIKIGVLATSTQEINNNSIVYTPPNDKNNHTITGFGDIDHILGSDDLKITGEYNWDFIERNDIYPKKNKIKVGEIWDIEATYPDHAMLISKIKF